MTENTMIEAAAIELNEAVMDELFLAGNATDEEREFVKKVIAQTSNPWDVTPTLAIYRKMRENNLSL